MPGPQAAFVVPLRKGKGAPSGWSQCRGLGSAPRLGPFLPPGRGSLAPPSKLMIEAQVGLQLPSPPRRGTLVITDEPPCDLTTSCPHLAP